ncbi:hypothetical protein [Microseira wollei]|uniref:hypothetical protein n=1 Tax=Microseira wollei TaxID=467598 RepID=UPI001CFDFE91|nr:hypothetical protein [Microseira wollei]
MPLLLVCLIKQISDCGGTAFYNLAREIKRYRRRAPTSGVFEPINFQLSGTRDNLAREIKRYRRRAPTKPVKTGGKSVFIC